jgi:1,4-dihydroxy-2-naphthoate octaprenyltransferase
VGRALKAPLPLEAAILSALFFAGSYPLTQIYQHEEDARRGDLTLSRVLGVAGTFRWWLAWSGLAGALFGWFFWKRMAAPALTLLFVGALLPSFLQTVRWWKKSTGANGQTPGHRDAMQGAWLASGGLCLFLILLGVLN